MEVLCPDGKSAISGGLLASSANVVVYESRPAGENLSAWRVSAVGEEPFSLEAYAICALINVDVDIDVQVDVETAVDTDTDADADAEADLDVVTPTPSGG